MSNRKYRAGPLSLQAFSVCGTATDVCGNLNMSVHVFNVCDDMAF